MGKAEIHLPFPVSVNASHRAVKGRSILSARMRDWREEAGWMLNQQHCPRFTAPVEIHVFLTPPDRRRRDLDNSFKAILDLLKVHQIIIDDSREYVRKISAEWADNDNPCVVVLRECGA